MQCFLDGETDFLVLLTPPSSQNPLYIHYYLLLSVPPGEEHRAELLSSFANEEQRAQKGEVICPKPHS